VARADDVPDLAEEAPDAEQQPLALDRVALDDRPSSGVSGPGLVMIALGIRTFPTS
jgi:hypothetical protein